MNHTCTARRHQNLIRSSRARAGGPPALWNQDTEQQFPRSEVDNRRFPE